MSENLWNSSLNKRDLDRRCQVDGWLNSRFNLDENNFSWMSSGNNFSSSKTQNLKLQDEINLHSRVW